MQSIELWDLFVIAEAVLGEPAERLHRTVSLWRIESALTAPFIRVGGAELYPERVEKTAICCSRLLLNRPFPRGNGSIAYLYMREALAREGLLWVDSAGDPAEIEDAINARSAGRLSEEKFVSWVRSRVASEGGR
jgi:prophage maintenance system killer protein